MHGGGLLGGVGEQFALVRGDGVESDFAHVVDRRPKTDHPAIWGVPASNL